MGYVDDSKMNSKWHNFILKLDNVELDFKTVLYKLNDFLYVPFNKSIFDTDEKRSWSCEKQSWDLMSKK